MGRKKTSVLKVDMESKIPQLEKILKNGKATIVLVFADWCGHCQTFKKDIWNPMCEKEAVHNRVSVRDDMIRKTTLKDANFEYLPSVMVVDENGSLQTFPTPEGKNTNVIPTPKSLEDMTRIVNVPLQQASAAEVMKGGALLQTLTDIGQGVIPAGVLGSISLMLKGGKRTRKHKKSKRKTRRMK
jgi:hypothetical protein